MRRASFAVLIVALYVFIFAPLVVVILVSLNSGSVATLPLESVSLRWYWKAIETKSFVDSLLTSSWIAVGATLIAAPLALAATIGLLQGRFRWRSAIESFLLAPLLVPGIVFGIALLLTFSVIGVRPGPGRLLAAHVVIAFPYCVRTILASLARLDPALLEGARTLGATSFGAFRFITLPLAMPGIAAGMLFAFLQSFGDVPVSLFLADARNMTLPLAIMGYLEYSADPSVAAMSSLVTIVSLAAALLLERSFGLRKALG